jgi:hypothetical protein
VQILFNDVDVDSQFSISPLIVFVFPDILGNLLVEQIFDNFSEIKEEIVDELIPISIPIFSEYKLSS